MPKAWRFLGDEQMTEELKAILKRSNEKFLAAKKDLPVISDERAEEIEMEISARYYDGFIDA